MRIIWSRSYDMDNSIWHGPCHTEHILWSISYDHRNLKCFVQMIQTQGLTRLSHLTLVSVLPMTLIQLNEQIPLGLHGPKLDHYWPGSKNGSLGPILAVDTRIQIESFSWFVQVKSGRMRSNLGYDHVIIIWWYDLDRLRHHFKIPLWNLN